MTGSPTRSAFLACASAGALLAFPLAASAQQMPQGGGADASVLDEVIVTGTRVADRTRLTTIAPVDVIPAEALERQGTTELAQALSNLVPSMSFSRPSITDGTDSIRPATLRGLSPDQTLVLVNGARRHASALVNVNGSIGRGSAAVDLNAIPSVAIERVEVLREGASAQYGSDAIAGVINLRLREAREGGGMITTVGEYNTNFATARIPEGRTEKDGRTITVAGWQGLPLGEDGFLTVSAEYRDRNPTSRGDLDPRLAPRPARITSRYGDPDTRDATLYLNAGLPMDNGFELYGFSGFQHRLAESAATPRTFNNPNNDPAVYPDGFLPIIAPTADDLSAGAGVRGEIAGFDMDLNLVYGRNEIDYRVEDSINGSLVPNSPTSFDAGGLEYDQFVLGLDFVRRYEVGLFEPLNVAFGVEARREHFEIFAGELASFQFVPGRPGAGAGAQGFIGFRPSNEVDESRDSVGLYLDLDARLTEQLNISGAVRFENFSDFGSATTGKIAARYDVTDNLAFRGAVSTGFRAPGLQQSFFTATSINFIVIGGVSTPVEVTTFPATDPVAQALGARPLDAEESTNYSFGAVFHRGPFELTVDAYQIDITDRIVLSENLLGSPTGNPTAVAIFNLLNPPGSGGSVGGARFFVNGVDTTTKGVDIVGRYRLAYSDAGRLDFTLAANFNSTDVTRVPTIPTGVPIPNPPALFNRINVLTLEEGTPHDKLVFSTDLTQGDFAGTLRLQRFSDVLHPFSNTDPAFDVHTGDKTLVDLEGRYQITQNVDLAVGVNNLFDEYPDFTPATVNSNGALAFSNYSPFGFNGRFLYGRVSLSW
ncbi:TonB-dependent receptor plug domain-containing protein [Brevundimonas sp.]|uniref:TonB-dependent receptor plug domain-containing protein n=1 Tax=Brevundimonas sp. TaxID=1871086 RepID=UPI002FC91CBF